MDAFRLELSGYVLSYTRGGASLAITFSPMKPLAVTGERDVWGRSFLLKRNFSVLGIVPLENDWYRGEALHAYFKSAAFRTLLAAHDRHIFYGSSMGGYGACAFAAAAPGAIIVAHNPQTTLDTRIVPWESRFPQGRRQNWDGAFRDGKHGVDRASRALVTFDPHERLDAKHADRLGNAATFLRIPFVGHAVPEHLQRMALLGPVFDEFVAGSWNASAWRRSVRRRRDTRAFLRNLAGRATTPWRSNTIVKHATAVLGHERRTLLEVACICASRCHNGEKLHELAEELCRTGKSGRPIGQYWMVRGLAMMGRHADALALAEQSLEYPSIAGQLMPLIVPLAQHAGDREAGERMLGRVWTPVRAAWVDELRVRLTRAFALPRQ